MYPRRTGRLIAVLTLATLCIFLTVWLAKEHRQSNLNRALIDAIRHSDADKVDSLLSYGADPDARATPVIQESFLQQLKHLLHRPPPDEFAPAIVVAVNSARPKARIISALINRGANVNARYTYMGTALNMFHYYHASGNTAEMLDILLDAGAFVDARGFLATTPLMDAVQFPGSSALITRLLDHDADTMAVDRSGKTPLLIACIHHQTANVQLLLDRGARYDSASASGVTQAMIKRIIFEADSMNGMRMAPGASTSQAGYATPLSIAQREGYIDIVKLLSGHGAK